MASSTMKCWQLYCVLIGWGCRNCPITSKTARVTGVQMSMAVWSRYKNSLCNDVANKRKVAWIPSDLVCYSLENRCSIFRALSGFLLGDFLFFFVEEEQKPHLFHCSVISWMLLLAVFSWSLSYSLLCSLSLCISLRLKSPCIQFLTWTVHLSQCKPVCLYVIFALLSDWMTGDETLRPETTSWVSRVWEEL